MKSNIISAIVLGGIFFQPLVTSALPETEVIQRLENVPTFTIVDQDGNPVPIKLNSQSNAAQNNSSLALVFINPQDALDTLQTLTQKKPELKNNLSVTPVNLSEIYEILQEAKQNQAKQAPLEIVPIISEVPLARDLIEASGATKLKNPEQVGIPLFYAAVGEQEDYMIRQDVNNNSYIPFYWTKKEVEEDIAAYKKGDPSAESQPIKIKAVSLEQFIQTLLENDNDAVKAMQIVPSAEQIDTANQMLQ